MSSVSPALISQDSGKKKKGFFARLFGKGDKAEKTVTPPAEEKSKPAATTMTAAAPTTATTTAAVTDKPRVADEMPFSQPILPAENDKMMKRHEELIKSVDEICKSLESSKAQKVEVSVTDVVPPFPKETFDSLNKTQQQVSGVLGQVAGRLDEAGKRDGFVIDSLAKMDGTLMGLTAVSERSVTTMDGMKGVFSEVSGSMESVREELKESGRRYEKLCEKVRKSDLENSATIAKLQKRTLTVTALLGVAIVIGIIVVAMGN